MSLDLREGKLYDDMVRHHGHEIAMVEYGDASAAVALECETCGEVLLEADRPDGSFVEMVDTIKEALEGDSNDADHDALVMVAEHFGIDYDPDPNDGKEEVNEHGT